MTALLGGAIVLVRQKNPKLASQLAIVYVVLAAALVVASWWLS